MSRLKKVDQDTLKDLNRQIILNHIRSSMEISRIDLAKHTRLSPTTVSTIVSELVSKKLVTETRIGESSGGRKPLMLGINPYAKFVCVVILTQKGVDISIADLNYRIVQHRSISRKIENRDILTEVLAAGMKAVLNEFQYHKSDICGVGISVPGVVDHRNGRILYSSKLGLNDFDISAVMKAEFDMKSYIFKDTDALILGEYNFGPANDYNSLAYIGVEHGVGMSYINSGRIFHPGIGGGFELGHITIDSSGPLCRCGNRGCLGAMVSEQPVLEKLSLLREKGYETHIKENIRDLTLADVVEYANRGDKLCRYVLEEQARILGIAIATVVNLFNPQLVLIGGPLSNCDWGFIEILKDTVRDRALAIYSRTIEIKPAKPSEESALLGIANDIFTQEVFKRVSL